MPNGDESAVPTPLVDGTLLVSGEVTQATAFEQGFPAHFAKREGSWGPDPLIQDDQFVVAHVRGKGLVIVTGCATWCRAFARAGRPSMRSPGPCPTPSCPAAWGRPTCSRRDISARFAGAPPNGMWPLGGRGATAVARGV